MISPRTAQQVVHIAARRQRRILPLAMQTPHGLPSEQWSDSFWHSEPSTKLLGHRSTSDLPECADVVIVGSGITAVGAAWKLLRNPGVLYRRDGKSFSVVMLEAREACWGATGRNGGHCFPIVYDFPEDPSIGHFELANLQAIEALIRKLDIDCDYCPQSSVRGIYSRTDLEEVERALKVLGQKDASLAAHVHLVTDPAELAALRVPSAIAATTCDVAARFWPYKFVARLLEDLVSSVGKTDQNWPLNLQTTTPVTSLHPVDDGDDSITRKTRAWKLTTPRGIIEAPRVILATNGHLSALLPCFSDLIVPCRGQVAALIPPPEATGVKRINRNHIFAGHGFYDYLVQLPDERGRHLIFGGGDETAGLGYTNDSVVDEDTATYLRRRLHDHLGLSEITNTSKPELQTSHQWTGIMGYSRDGLPWVGPVPSHPGIFVAAGYTGNGMPNAFLCGQAVAAMVKSEMQEWGQEDAMQAATEDSEIGLPRAYSVSQERIDWAQKLEIARW